MPDLASPTNCVIALLIHYSFDLGGYTAGELITRWLDDYPANWIHLAVIEALYQGRYKAISVDQILAFWQRRGTALYHFNHEFERLICGENLPRKQRSKYEARTNSAITVSKAAVYSGSSQNHAAAAVKPETKQSEQVAVQVIDARQSVPPVIKEKTQAAPIPTQLTSSSITKQPPTPDSESNNQSSIPQFHPTATAASDFHYKLKAIVRRDRSALIEDEC